MATYITEQQLAAFVPISVKTLRKWRWLANVGKGNPGPAFIRLGGRKIVYDLEQVQLWIDGQIVQGSQVETGGVR